MKRIRKIHGIKHQYTDIYSSTAKLHAYTYCGHLALNYAGHVDVKMTDDGVISTIESRRSIQLLAYTSKVEEITCLTCQKLVHKEILDKL